MLQTNNRGSRCINTCLKPVQILSLSPKTCLVHDEAQNVSKCISTATGPQDTKGGDGDKDTGHGHGAQMTKQGFVVCALGASSFFFSWPFFIYLFILLVSFRLIGPRQPRANPTPSLTLLQLQTIHTSDRQQSFVKFWASRMPERSGIVLEVWERCSTVDGGLY